MALIKSLLVILATSLVARPQGSHALPQPQDVEMPPSPTPSTSVTISPTLAGETQENPSTRVASSPPAPDAETSSPSVPDLSLGTLPASSTTRMETTTTPMDTTSITTPTTTTMKPTPSTTDPAQPDTPSQTTILSTNPTSSPPSSQPNTDSTDTPPANLTTSPDTNDTTPSSSPTTTITTVSPATHHPGTSVLITLFVLLGVFLMIGVSVWWIRRRWQLERLRHQLMPVYNFDPTDDVDDWENQLLEEERSLRPEADKVQLYSGNATFEAGQKPPNNTTQKE